MVHHGDTEGNTEKTAVVELPSGQWAAAVSGGADSVALLWLCRAAVGHIVHLDHGLRGEDSAADATFVEALADRLGIAATVVRLTPEVLGGSAVTPAGLREVRLRLYRRVVEEQGLAGVLLGHHADDVAETVALRLLHGAGVTGLSGMNRDASVSGVRCMRPLLGWHKREVTAYLRSIGERWREDESNGLPRSDRNRIRMLIGARPGLAEALGALAEAGRSYRQALEGRGTIGEGWRASDWATMPRPLLRVSALNWLREVLPPDKVSMQLVERLIAWAVDAGNGARFELPGHRYAVRRNGGRISFMPR